DGLTANSDHVFGLWVNQGFAEWKRAYPHLWQGGLGMAGREDYLDASAQRAEGRARYQAHIAAMLKLAGTGDSENKAARILALETQMARASAPDEDAADVFKQNNLWKREEFATKAPGIDWDAYFQAAGLTEQREFLVWQPSAVTGVAGLVSRESI